MSRERACARNASCKNVFMKDKHFSKDDTSEGRGQMGDGPKQEDGPLSALRVLHLSNLIADPRATMLGDVGAGVVK